MDSNGSSAPALTADRSPPAETAAARALVAGASAVLRGKSDFLEYLTAAALAGGHVLLDDLPGLGKTTVAKAFARLVADDDGRPISFKRIQFTPDLLPYDVTGVDVFDPGSRAFRFVPGPVFAHVVLADEINRATPKVQSALLEVMAETQVTVGGATHPVADPFIVIATQNPVESEGTFPLPAAQLDRFMLRLSLGYPDLESELAILAGDPSANDLPALRPAVSKADFLAARAKAAEVFCHPDLLRAIADAVRETRAHKGIALGVSPRGALHFLKAARAYALVRGRGYVVDEDLVRLAPLALAHRLRLRDPRAKAADIVRDIVLARVERLGRP